MGLARQAVSRIRRSVQKTICLTKIRIRVVIHPNAVAGRDAAQFNVPEQDNLARRIVALCVFGGVHLVYPIASFRPASSDHC
jgi:cytochrome P450